MERMDCSIADLRVCLEVGGRTARQAEAYRAPPTSGPPDLMVSCDPEQIMKSNPWIKDMDMAEYMGTGASFAQQLLFFSGFQLHAAAVELEGRAYLFSGPCGVGKSTHGEKWMRLFGATLLNDDKPALRYLAGKGWIAYGTPWSGKENRSCPRGAPVETLIFLKRGEENCMEWLSPVEALPLLLSQTPRPLQRKGMERLLQLADQLLQEVPIWRLTCRNDDNAAYLAHAAVCGQESER